MKQIQKQLQQLKENQAGGDDQASRQLASELAELSSPTRPDDIPPDVWSLIQDNGRLATERLNEILNDPRFIRYSPAAQAKLIQLAQDRAYGRANPGVKRVEKRVSHELADATAASLNRAKSRLHLPEYRNAIDAQEASPHEPQEAEINASDLR